MALFNILTTQVNLLTLIITPLLKTLLKTMMTTLQPYRLISKTISITPSKAMKKPFAYVQVMAIMLSLMTIKTNAKTLLFLMAHQLSTASSMLMMTISSLSSSITTPMSPTLFVNTNVVALLEALFLKEITTKTF